MGVPEASVAVLTTPLKGAVRSGEVVKLYPHRTARAPSERATLPGTMRVSVEAPAAALYRTMRGSPYEKR